MRPMLAITRYTLLEAARNRLFGVLLIGLFCVTGLAQFAGELAITETRQVQGAIAGMALRLFGVLVISLCVITAMAREFNDGTIEVLIALPFSRPVYVLGKLGGFLCLSLTVAALLCVPLLLYAAPFQVGVWGVSLVCELFIVTALGLFFVLALGSVTPAVAAVAAFYVLARSVGAFRLVSRSPVLEGATPFQAYMQGAVDLLACILPDLDRYARTEWLVYGTGSPEDLSLVIIQTVITLAVLIAAALLDFCRKNF